MAIAVPSKDNQIYWRHQFAKSLCLTYIALVYDCRWNRSREFFCKQRWGRLSESFFPYGQVAIFDQFYFKIKGNRWYWYFSIFCRLTLAFAFLVAGMVKITGERFASGLSDKHPMGAYLQALYHTGFYYTFIGIAQVVAAILLIIPKTVTIGALIYFPIIINIWLLSLAVRFEGSFVTSPLMVLANVYILVWNYDRLRYILPFQVFSNYGILQKPDKFSNKFPFLFFTAVATTVGLTVALSLYGLTVMPRNSLSDCRNQFVNTARETVGCKFCDCIHKDGRPLKECLEEFEIAIKKEPK